MFKYSMEYTDFNGDNRKEDLYFNLTEAEIKKFNYAKNGTLAAQAQRILDSNDYASMIDLFDELIDKAYCVRSDDGSRLIKNAKLLEEFKSSQAYSDFFVKLTEDPDFAEKFFIQLLPVAFQKPVKEQISKQGYSLVTEEDDAQEVVAEIETSEATE